MRVVGVGMKWVRRGYEAGAGTHASGGTGMSINTYLVGTGMGLKFSLAMGGRAGMDINTYLVGQGWV